MASSMIHIAVANEVNKVINKDRKNLLIGSIAPDIGKHVGIDKIVSHFQDTDDDIPNLGKFLDKYGKYLDDDFVLGYYIHLYTDYLWFKYFVPNFINNGYIYKLDGTKVDVSDDENADYYYKKFFYNDYSNLNIQLIDKYNLELDMFYEKTPVFNNIIKEIPMDKIQIIIDQAGIIIENTKENKAYVFDMNLINEFIKLCSDYIILDLKDN